MRQTGSITQEQILYGYSVAVRLHESKLFYVKGREGNKVLLNRFPDGVKSVEILDEHADVIPILGKTFPFKPHTKNIVMITTNDDKFVYYEYRPEKGGFVEKKFFD